MKNLQRKSQHYKIIPQQRGLTLVEIIVAIGIFMVVVTIGMGALLSTNVAYRNTQASREVYDSLAFALETMTREIRVGTNYNCGTTDGGDCSLGQSYLSFTPADSTVASSIMAYGLNSDSSRIIQSINDEDIQFLTPETVRIKKLDFYVFGTDSLDDGDVQQPFVLIRIDAEAKIGKEIRSMTLQTGVSQRVLDI